MALPIAFTTSPTAFLTTKMGAEKLGLSRERVRTLVLEGKLKTAGRAGKTWLFDPREVERYLKGRKP